jgi:hypothetical protein
MDLTQRISAETATKSYDYNGGLKELQRRKNVRSYEGCVRTMWAGDFFIESSMFKG